MPHLLLEMARRNLLLDMARRILLLDTTPRILLSDMELTKTASQRHVRGKVVSCSIVEKSIGFAT